MILLSERVVTVAPEQYHDPSARVHCRSYFDLFKLSCDFQIGLRSRTTRLQQTRGDVRSLPFSDLRHSTHSGHYLDGVMTQDGFEIAQLHNRRGGVGRGRRICGLCFLDAGFLRRRFRDGEPVVRRPWTRHHGRTSWRSGPPNVQASKRRLTARTRASAPDPLRHCGPSYDKVMQNTRPPMDPLVIGLSGGVGAGFGQYFLSGKSIPWAVGVAVCAGIGIYYFVRYLNRPDGRL